MTNKHKRAGFTCQKRIISLHLADRYGATTIESIGHSPRHITHSRPTAFYRIQLYRRRAVQATLLLTIRFLDANNNIVR